VPYRVLAVDDSLNFAIGALNNNTWRLDGAMPAQTTIWQEVLIDQVGREKTLRSQFAEVRRNTQYF